MSAGEFVPSRIHFLSAAAVVQNLLKKEIAFACRGRISFKEGHHSSSEQSQSLGKLSQNDEGKVNSIWSPSCPLTNETKESGACPKSLPDLFLWDSIEDTFVLRMTGYEDIGSSMGSLLWKNRGSD
jgi:hypothetical protein